MKAKFTVTQDEMMIYKEAFRNKLLVSLPGAKGKHVLGKLDIDPVGDMFELSVEFGKVAKRGKKKDLL